MKTFLSLLAFAVGINIAFAVLTNLFFHGQISGADSFPDYFYYAVGHLTTSGSGELSPMTDGVRIWTSLYVLTTWVFIFYVAVNHIRNIKIGGFS